LFRHLYALQISEGALDAARRQSGWFEASIRMDDAGSA